MFYNIFTQLLLIIIIILLVLSSSAKEFLNVHSGHKNIFKWEKEKHETDGKKAFEIEYYNMSAIQDLEHFRQYIAMKGEVPQIVLQSDKDPYKDANGNEKCSNDANKLDWHAEKKPELLGKSDAGRKTGTDYAKTADNIFINILLALIVIIIIIEVIFATKAKFQATAKEFLKKKKNKFMRALKFTYKNSGKFCFGVCITALQVALCFASF